MLKTTNSLGNHKGTTFCQQRYLATAKIITPLSNNWLYMDLTFNMVMLTYDLEKR